MPGGVDQVPVKVVEVFLTLDQFMGLRHAGGGVVEENLLCPPFLDHFTTVGGLVRHLDVLILEDTDTRLSGSRVQF